MIAQFLVILLLCSFLNCYKILENMVKGLCIDLMNRGGL